MTRYCRLHVARRTRPRTVGTVTDTVRLACTDLNGAAAPFADIVRAVYRGDADPADYTVNLEPCAEQADPAVRHDPAA